MSKECKVEKFEHVDVDTNTDLLNIIVKDTNTDPLNTLTRDTNTDPLNTFARDTNTDPLNTLARDTNTHPLKTFAKDTNTDPIVRKVQFSHTTTNTNSEVFGTLTVKETKLVDATTDTKDIIIITTSIVDDDHSDTKSLHSVDSHLDDEFYDPVRNGNAVKNALNQGHCLVQDSSLIENPTLNAKSELNTFENKNIEEESKSLKPTLSRCERSRSPSPKKVIQKNSSNRMISKNKKNVKNESYKQSGSPQKKLTNGLPIDSHFKTHQKFEKEAQQKFEKESWDSLIKKDIKGFRNNRSNSSNSSNASDEHCKSHEFTNILDVSDRKKINRNKMKVTGVPNFQSKLSNEHCKSHQFESPKSDSEKIKVTGNPNFQSKLVDEHCKSHKFESPKSEDETLLVKTPRSQSPWTKATPIIKTGKIKPSIKKKPFKQIKKSTPTSKSPRSSPLESPRTPRCPRDRDSTPPSSRHYVNPKGLKPLKACAYKPNAKHPQPWIMPSPNAHYDDIEIDSLPPTPRYCSRDKEPLPQYERKYSPTAQSNKSHDSSSPSCFGMVCNDVSKPKETTIRKDIQHKKIADFIVQDLPPLKLSKISKSLQSSPPSMSPLSSSPFTTPRKIQIPLTTLKEDKPQRFHVKLNQITKTRYVL